MTLFCLNSYSSLRPLWLQFLGLMLLIWACKGLRRFFEVRMMFRRLKDQGIPMMPHSFLFGHLGIIYRLTKGKPSDMHANYIASLLMQNWKSVYPDQKSCPGLLYVDMWPIAPPIIFTIDPALPGQSFYNLHHHHPNTLGYLKPLTENLDLVSFRGETWRTWRTRLSYGFAPKNITALLPTILDEVVVFCDVLRSKAGENGSWGDSVQLEPMTTSLTFDIIARAALDIRLGEQTQGPSPFRRAMADQLTHCLFEYNILTLPHLLNPVRYWKMARNSRVMRQFLMPHILARLENPSPSDTKPQANPDSEHPPSQPPITCNNANSTIIDLAVQAFRREATTTDPLQPTPPSPDALFINTLLGQLKISVFAGHDTTAATLCWALHSLSIYPRAAASLRRELDAVFGPDPASLVPLLRAQPHLLYQLPYTTAFIKEVLRFQPSGAVIRISPPDDEKFTFHLPGDDTVYPTAGFMVWDAIVASMKYEGAWPRADEFLPERWLARPDEELHVRKNAWRAFGLGPRQCIGQELAMAELRLAVAAVAREMEIECAWGKWDKAMGYQGPKNEMEGHRCYQVGKIVPHVSGGMPVHVRMRT
ncbi:cytochrome P450 4V3 [Apodospora peruviana]|uniref:Cytochrome P450 4V3 n=1 Tax=Apodospora peruviana TaxID=516989 RepID=A0AAE0HWP5_9PEZI|nr:cytochrome P450 4V3 [Apodospora peruviana]